MKKIDAQPIVKTEKYYNELFRIIRKAGSRSNLARALEISFGCVSNWLNNNEKHIPSAYNSYMLNRLYKGNQKILRGEHRNKLISSS